MDWAARAEFWCFGFITSLPPLLLDCQMNSPPPSQSGWAVPKWGHRQRHERDPHLLQFLIPPPPSPLTQMGGQPTHPSTSGGVPPQKANKYVHLEVPTGILTHGTPPPPRAPFNNSTPMGGGRHLGLTHTETQRGRLWTACGQRRVDSKNSQTTPATTSTSPIRQLLGAADAQTAHHATFSTAPTHQLLGSANAETAPARAPAAAADRTQRPDATCEGKNG